MKIITNLTLYLLITLLIVAGCGGGDDDKEATAEEQQLALLSKTWTITNATKDVDRTDDFQDPDLTLQISGAYNAGNPKGPYNYKITGTLPEPTPWASGSGTWMFGTDPSHTILRDDDVEITYTLNGNTLTLSFTCTTCGEDNSREKSAEGEWVFTFTAP